MRGSKYTEETRAAALEAYKQGTLLADIEAKLGVPAATVGMWAKRAGLSRRAHQRNVREQSPIRLTGGAWVYGKDGIARWTPGAVPAEDGAA